MRRLLPLCLALALVACDTAVPTQPVDEGSGGASVFFLAEDGAEVASILVSPLGRLAVGDAREGGFSLFVVGQDDVRHGTFELACIDDDGEGALVARFLLDTGEDISLHGWCDMEVGAHASEGDEWVWTDGTGIIGEGTFSRGEMVP